MPILLHVDELKPGLCLAQAVYQGDNRMICGGQQLEQWHIDSLRRRMPNLVVRVLDPILDKMTDFQDDSANEAVASTVTSRMSRMMGSVQAKIGARTALDGSDLTGLQAAIQEVIGYLNDHPVTAAILFHSEGKNAYLQEHAANVMYLSLLVGNAVRDYIYHERIRTTNSRTLAVRYGINLTPLALGCLFHDLGMMELEELYTAKRPLTAEEQERLHNHPFVGADMLPAETDAVARMIVRTHHENVNGTGYPQRLPGHKLHVFSRIVRVADAYDAGTSERVYKQAKTPARVLWELTMGEARHFYDPLIARILAGLVQPFPIGAKIRLSTGGFGVVVRHNRKHPFRPTVLVAFDDDGRRLKRKHLRPPISLIESPDVRLVEFAGHDLSFLNSSCDVLPEFSPAYHSFREPEPITPPVQDRADLFSYMYP